MKLSTIKTMRRTVTVTIPTDAEPLTAAVEYNFGALTDENDKKQLPDWLEAVVNSWDMVYGDDTPVPPTRAGIEEAARRGEAIPTPILMLIMASIVEDSQPNKLRVSKKD